MESHNAYGDPQYQDIIAGLKEELIRQRKLLGDTDEGNIEILEIIAKHWDD